MANYSTLPIIRVERGDKNFRRKSFTLKTTQNGIVSNKTVILKETSEKTLTNVKNELILINKERERADLLLMDTSKKKEYLSKFKSTLKRLNKTTRSYYSTIEDSKKSLFSNFTSITKLTPFDSKNKFRKQEIELFLRYFKNEDEYSFIEDIVARIIQLKKKMYYKGFNSTDFEGRRKSTSNYFDNGILLNRSRSECSSPRDFPEIKVERISKSAYNSPRKIRKDRCRRSSGKKDNIYLSIADILGNKEFSKKEVLRKKLRKFGGSFYWNERRKDEKDELGSEEMYKTTLH